jgi:hypothetical protein
MSGFSRVSVVEGRVLPINVEFSVTGSAKPAPCVLGNASSNFKEEVKNPSELDSGPPLNLKDCSVD